MQEEIARIAELKAEAAAFKKRQALEEQKLHLHQEQDRLTLEVEIAKSEAKERVLATIMEAEPRSFVLCPTSLAPKVSKGNIPAPSVGENMLLPVIVGRSIIDPKPTEWPPSSMTTNKKACVAESEHSGASSSPRERAFHEMLGLHQHQNALRGQQNKIVEMLATQQKKINLPQQRVPIFDGDPMEYASLLEHSRTSSRLKLSSERLYYLEQFTSGDVKELVHFLPPDKGYQEARRLLKSKFGDNYRVLTAHESKALNWAEVKPEDSTSLNRFSIFLMRCKNAMESGKYLSKFEQPDTIQRLIMKLPFNLRAWRRLVDHIMETEERNVTFSDLAEFLDNEARVTDNPVFGKILEDAKPKQNTRNGRPPKKLDQKNSFAAQASGDQNPPSSVQVSGVQNLPFGAPPPGPAPLTVEVSCSYCNSGHALDTCEALRRLPYQD